MLTTYARNASLRDVKVADLAIGMRVGYCDGIHQITAIDAIDACGLIRVQYDYGKDPNGETVYRWRLHPWSVVVHVVTFDEELGIRHPVDAEMVA